MTKAPFVFAGLLALSGPQFAKACGSFVCAANATSSFDTYMRIVFDAPVSTFSRSFGTDLAADIPVAYDTIAGALCDPNSRRIISTTVQILEADYAIVKVSVEQSGESVYAFDTDSAVVSASDITNFEGFCSVFFEETLEGATCCCACMTLPTGGISKTDFAVELESELGETVLQVIELGEFNDAECEGTWTTFTSELYACTDSAISDLNEFGDIFMEVYDDMASSTCFPVDFTNVDVTVHDASTNAYKVEVTYKTPKSACAGCPDEDIMCERFGKCRRRLHEAASRPVTTTTKQMDFASAVVGKREAARALGMYGNTDDICLCPVGNGITTPTFDGVEYDDFVSEVNDELEDAGETTILSFSDFVPDECSG